MKDALTGLGLGAAGALLMGLALIACEGCGGTLENRNEGGEPEDASELRIALQKGINAVGRMRTAADRAMGTHCQGVTSDADEMTADQFEAAIQPCQVFAELDRRLVGPGPAPGGALQALEDAADRYEATRDREGLEDVAPCVVGLVLDLERVVQASADYDLGALVARVRAGLATFADGQCSVAAFGTPEEE